ncbi:L,D-transpeptidase [Acidimangrovimonas pyrenivorans]|uniref:L,D-transpeptidase family protein n=1 Tax=Acidimangrovimonas pyrenivorans TaxID=2030798 RepID=A0ABV7AN09_9RHOB
MTLAEPSRPAQAFRPLRAVAALALVLGVAACASQPDAPDPKTPAVQAPDPATVARYGTMEDNGITIDAINPGYLLGSNARTLVYYNGPEPAGTIVVDPYARRLYLVMENGMAMRYGIAVGREGKGYSGDATIGRKQEWPHWQPTRNMLKTEPEKYGDYAQGLDGGIENPLGARALYLYNGKRDTYYRIHGTNNPSTIGRATSAGCIRLFNQDAIDLFDRVPKGAHVHVRTLAESLKYEGSFTEGPTGLLKPVSDPDTVVTGPTANAVLDSTSAATDAALASASQATGGSTASTVADTTVTPTGVSSATLPPDPSTYKVIN